jgi:hypothetical protein
VSDAGPGERHAAGRHRRDPKDPRPVVERDDVDRDAHADGVHRPTALEHERGPLIETLATEQPPGTLAPGLGEQQ